METLKIRLANSQDAALAADMSRTTFYETFAASNTTADMDLFMNSQFTREVLMKETAEPGNIFLLAYFNEEPAGYALVREGELHPEFKGKPSIEIARIYSIKSMIGKGIGSALMQACLDTAISLNREIVWLGVWEKNERALAFYQRWGFEKFGIHDFRLGNDIQQDWLMMKHLDTQLPYPS